MAHGHWGDKRGEGEERTQLERRTAVMNRNFYGSENHACSHLANSVRTRLNEETNGMSS